MVDQLLTVKQVASLVGYSRCYIWSSARAGSFPLPIKINTKHIRWLASEVEAWRAGDACPPARAAVAPDALLTVDEVSNALCMSDWQICQHLFRGSFPLPIKIGDKNVLFRETDIDRWIQSLPRAEYPMSKAA